MNSEAFPSTGMTDAYLAGIIDGEGSITIRRRTVRGRSYHQPIVRVGNTSERLITWLRGHYGGSFYMERRGDDVKPFYQWAVAGGEAETVLRRIARHVVIKDRQVELALRLRDTISGRTAMSVQTREAREAMRLEMRALNAGAG